MFVDSHCHLDFPELATDLPNVLAAMREHAVTHALCIGVDLPAWPQVLAIAHAHANLFATVGVHPDYTDTPEPTVAELVAMVATPKVVAIGETGLDYYRLEGDLEWQRERFRRHIRAARETGKPLVIHTRSAAVDTLAIMREERAGEAGGGMPCFSENREGAGGAPRHGLFTSRFWLVPVRKSAPC